MSFIIPNDVIIVGCIRLEDDRNLNEVLRPLKMIIPIIMSTYQLFLRME